mmetsp:Transcript_82661/g.208002  ORF Transcript_82661/g.208002 Transcript_82661/m.208002 type:complete len:307 (-) Transcript_82661:759-1679(-)
MAIGTTYARPSHRRCARQQAATHGVQVLRLSAVRALMRNCTGGRMALGNTFAACLRSASKTPRCLLLPQVVYSKCKLSPPSPMLRARPQAATPGPQVQRLSVARVPRPNCKGIPIASGITSAAQLGRARPQAATQGAPARSSSVVRAPRQKCTGGASAPGITSAMCLRLPGRRPLSLPQSRLQSMRQPSPRSPTCRRPWNRRPLIPPPRARPDASIRGAQARSSNAVKASRPIYRRLLTAGGTTFAWRRWRLPRRSQIIRRRPLHRPRRSPRPPSSTRRRRPLRPPSTLCPRLSCQTPVRNSSPGS